MSNRPDVIDSSIIIKPPESTPGTVARNLPDWPMSSHYFGHFWVRNRCQNVKMRFDGTVEKASFLAF
jgi:hypothetical protein